MVLDASAVVEFLLGGDRGRAVERVLAGNGSRLQAPALLDVEVVQAFRRLAATEVIPESRARAATEILAEMPILRQPVTPLIPRLWQLRRNLTAYDAAYVALAEVLKCPLVTFDAAIAGASGHTAEVIVPT